VGVFCEELMACAAEVRVGPAREVFWALYTRADGRLRERTRMLGRGAVQLTAASGAGEPGRLRVADGGVELEVALMEGVALAEGGARETARTEGAGGASVALPTWWETTCADGAAYVWTRKQAGVRAHGTLALDGGAPRPIEALAVIDDTAGYHARVTEWWWAAGVGVDPEGRPLAFNLVEGINDPSRGSERAVWVEGVPREAPAVRFARDLSRIVAADGAELRFAAEAERRRRENVVVVSSDYRAPFGSFSGTLPGGIELARGLGVVEHHRARW
jgi:hypothetical protein